MAENQKLKIGFGGGCHWCTEAVFQHLSGVELVEQGWIASAGSDEAFSEAVIIHFNPDDISLEVLIEVHLHTHKSTKAHSMREKYRSAIYTFSEVQQIEVQGVLTNLQKTFDAELVTRLLPFVSFKTSGEEVRNYYLKNPRKPFCETYIDPKLKLLLERFSAYIDEEKLNLFKEP